MKGMKKMANIIKIEEMAKNLITEVDNIYNELNTDLQNFRIKEVKQYSKNELVKICEEDAKRIEEINKEIEYKNKELEEVVKKMNKIFKRMGEICTITNLSKLSIKKALRELDKSKKENKLLEEYKELQEEYTKIEQYKEKVNSTADCLKYLKRIIKDNIKEVKYNIIFKIAIEFFAKMDGEKITERIADSIQKEYCELFEYDIQDMYVNINTLGGIKFIVFAEQDDYKYFNYGHRFDIENGTIDAIRLTEKLDKYIIGFKLYNFNNLEKIKKIILEQNTVLYILEKLSKNINFKNIKIDVII